MRTFSSIIFCWLLLGLGAPAAGQVTKEGIFLSFSDLHFDPFGFPGLTDTLMASPAEQWPGIFQAAGKRNGFGGLGADVNYNLFISALQQMKAVHPRPNFIVMTGDFLSHDFGPIFQQQTGITNPDSLFHFIYKTLQFVTATVESYFPGVTLFPVLGNNDSYCGDYQGETSGLFYKQVSDLWYPLVRKVVNKTAFKTSFRRGGYYAAQNPADSGHRIIVLNTVVYSSSYDAKKYPNYCGDSIPDSAAVWQTAWLKTQLQECRRLKKKVWLLYHIPPGINAYASSSGFGDCTSNITGFWNSKYNKLFIDLVTQYKDVVALNMAGHTHMDHFELLLDSTLNPASFVHITPAISPIFYDYPAFEEISYLKGSATWKDYTAWYFRGFSGDSAGNTWGKEYRFGQVYGAKTITARSLLQAYVKIFIDSLTRRNFIRLYNVNNTRSPAITAKTFPAYWCAIGFLDEGNYAKCACNQEAPSLAMQLGKPRRGEKQQQKKQMRKP